MRYFVFTADFRWIGSVYGYTPAEALQTAKLKYWLCPAPMVAPAEEP